MLAEEHSREHSILLFSVFLFTPKRPGCNCFYRWAQDQKSHVGSRAELTSVLEGVKPRARDGDTARTSHQRAQMGVFPATCPPAPHHRIPSGLGRGAIVPLNRQNLEPLAMPGGGCLDYINSHGKTHFNCGWVQRSGHHGLNNRRRAEH